MNQSESIRGVLAAMNISPDRVNAALNAIEGKAIETPHDEPLLTPEDLRDRLRVSAVTIWRMKGLPFIMVGSRKRFLWSEVQRYLATCQKRQGSEMAALRA